MIYIGRESVKLGASPSVPQQDLTSHRVPVEHVNSAGVDSKSPVEKGSFGDTTFHLSSALALIIVRTMRNLQSKSTTV